MAGLLLLALLAGCGPADDDLDFTGGTNGGALNEELPDHLPDDLPPIPGNSQDLRVADPLDRNDRDLYNGQIVYYVPSTQEEMFNYYTSELEANGYSFTEITMDSDGMSTEAPPGEGHYRTRKDRFTMTYRFSPGERDGYPDNIVKVSLIYHEKKPQE